MSSINEMQKEKLLKLVMKYYKNITNKKDLVNELLEHFEVDMNTFSKTRIHKMIYNFYNQFSEQQLRKEINDNFDLELPKKKEEPKKKQKDYYNIKDSEVEQNYIDNLKFKDLEFKNVLIEKIKFNDAHSYRKIISNIYENQQHNSHKSFIYTEEGKTTKILKIELVKVIEKFKRQQYTEKTFMLLWAYIKKIKLLDEISSIDLDYAASVPVWTTYNRMINEAGYYNKLFDEILKKIKIDDDIKFLVHEVLYEMDYVIKWVKKNNNENEKYYKKLKDDFVILLERRFYNEIYKIPREKLLSILK